MTRRTEFFEALAALMEEHSVTITAVEGYHGYSASADGIDFDFDSLPYTDEETLDTRDKDRDYYCVECRLGTCELDAETIRKLREESE